MWNSGLATITHLRHNREALPAQCWVFDAIWLLPYRPHSPRERRKEESLSTARTLISLLVLSSMVLMGCQQKAPATPTKAPAAKEAASPVAKESGGPKGVSGTPTIPVA